MSDQDPSEEAARREAERKRILAPMPPDPDDPRMLRWTAMPDRARAAACLAALLQRWPIDVDQMRFDPLTGVVHVVRPDPSVRGRSRSTSRTAPATARESIDAVRALFGYRADEVDRLVNRRR